MGGRRGRAIALIASLGLAAGAGAQEWDSIRGAIETLDPPGPHHFLLRGRHIGYLVDGDAGEVEGTLTTSMFSPALRPHAEAGRVYSYGAYYTRTYYGERTDAVTTYDLETLAPTGEVIIPPKSAGIGHAGMMGLVDDRFIGVWNITPAMSVSIVDVREQTFVGEISTPGCAAVYPVDGGFVMPCGDGALLKISLDGTGRESGRSRTREFFDVSTDPVFDYAVPRGEGWLFVSLEGQVFEVATSGDDLEVRAPWSIFGTVPRMADDEDGWRIGGSQPFAYSSATGLFATLMHEGGGQETFEDKGTQIWVYDGERRAKGYVIELDQPARAIGFTADAEPLLVVVADDEIVEIRDGRTGHLLRTMEEMGVSTVQPFDG